MATNKSQIGDNSHTDWEQKGADWKAILDNIQPVAQHLASRFLTPAVSRGLLPPEVHRERWDAPEINLQWEADDKIGRAVQAAIKGDPGAYKLRISCSAWKDDLESKWRQWRTENIETIAFSAPPHQREIEEFEVALCAAFEIVSGWGESHLKNSDRLPDHDLPSTDAER